MRNPCAASHRRPKATSEFAAAEAQHESALATLKSFISERHDYLISHAELTPAAPAILTVERAEEREAGVAVSITAEVDGSSSV
jgi:hypothetical protein